MSLWYVGCPSSCLWQDSPSWKNDFWVAWAILDNFCFQKKKFSPPKKFFPPSLFMHFWMFHAILSGWSKVWHNATKHSSFCIYRLWQWKMPVRTQNAGDLFVLVTERIQAAIGKRISWKSRQIIHRIRAWPLFGCIPNKQRKKLLLFQIHNEFKFNGRDSSKVSLVAEYRNTNWGKSNYLKKRGLFQPQYGCRENPNTSGGKNFQFRIN